MIQQCVTSATQNTNATMIAIAETAEINELPKITVKIVVYRVTSMIFFATIAEAKQRYTIS